MEVCALRLVGQSWLVNEEDLGLTYNFSRLGWYQWRGRHPVEG